MSTVQTESTETPEVVIAPESFPSSPLKMDNCGMLSIKDNHVYVTAYAYDDQRPDKSILPLFVSIAGTKQVITAIRSAFGVGHQVTADLGMGGRKLKWEPVKSSYSTIAAAPILQVNQQHMIIAHTALNGQMLGDDLYVKLPMDVENIPQAVLKRAEPFALIPMFPAWVPYLWERARENRLVTSLPCNGFKMYRVRLDSTWAKIVKIGVENGQLKPLRECVGLPKVESEKTNG